MWPSPFVVLRGDGCLLVAHIAVGNGVAGLVQRRAEVADCSYTATSLLGEPVHGANAAGLVCAVLDHPGHPLVTGLLGGCDGVGEAVAMLGTLAPGPSRPVALLLADHGQAVVARLRGGYAAVEAAGAIEAPGATLDTLIAAVRAAEPAPRPGATPAAGLAAVLRRDAPPGLHVALGPPSCSVFVRYWPGMELTPEVSAAPEGAALARLAAAVAQTTSTDAELRRGARARLDRAEAEALAEGEAAERMAALMDEHTDDRGAAVRRLVAQSYAAGLARQALEELAVPAPPRGGVGAESGL
ncbi:MAG TPA: hypothetical protein VN193_17100 [Candidatus Angelobacter sp.]|jgi:hypothetical protein|nr:hypothetical protein [Candidatus Angelobacter sp.]